MIQVPTQAYAIHRVVRIGEGQRNGAIGLARIESQRQGVTTAEQVLLGDRCRQHDALRAGEARTQHQIAGGALLDREVDIDLVGRTRHGRCLDVNLVEEAEAVDTGARTVDRRSVVPPSFHLAHLAANDLVARLGVAADVDPAHIHATTRIDEHREGDLSLFLVHLRSSVDVGEGIALIAQAVGDRLRGLGQPLARKGVARAQLGHRQVLRFGQHQIAGKAHTADGVLLALGDVHGDVDVLLVGRDRYLRRIDIEVQITLVQVKGTQRFKVGRQLLARVLVVLGVPGQPARRRQLHLLEQIVLVVCLRADDGDLPDLGDVAFLDIEIDAYPVALKRRDRGLDLGRVLSARQVLPLQLLFGTLEQRTVEDAGFGETDLAQARLERILVELLHADKVDLRNRRTLVHHHDDHITFGLDAYVAEETCREERTDCFCRLPLIETLTDPYRQVVEHGSRFGPLYAFDPDVLDYKRFERERRHSGKKGHDEPGQELAIHAGIQPEMRRLMSL